MFTALGTGTPNGLSGCSVPALMSWFYTFLKNCGIGEQLKTATRVECLVRGKQGHAACKILALEQIPFLRK